VYKTLLKKKKKGNVQRKRYIESTFEKDIKELDPRKAFKYLGVEQHKNEKEKLKREYLRRLI